MKKTAIYVWVLALLNFWAPYAQANISRDLDPMVPLEAEGAENVTASQTSNIVSTADAAILEKKEKSGKKKEKSKKTSKKSGKSSSKKSKK